MPTIAKVMTGILIIMFLSITFMIIHISNKPDPEPKDETNTLHLKDLDIKASGKLAKEINHLVS